MFIALTKAMPMGRGKVCAARREHYVAPYGATPPDPPGPIITVADESSWPS
jgi:hypothetical protein